MALCSSIYVLFLIISARGELTCKWHKVKTKSSLNPSPRFGASTWVDDDKWLWLFGGKNALDSGKRETAKQLIDLWKFNPQTMKWYYIPSQNTSRLPHYTNGLTCFCHGLAFSFGSRFYESKMFYELWTYNITSSIWIMKDLPQEVNTSTVCFALWCNHSLNAVSLFCNLNNHNNSSLQIWTYTIKNHKWQLEGVFSTENLTNLFLKNISKSNRYTTWIDKNGAVNMYHWAFENSSNSVLLSITHAKVTFTHVNQSFNCRTGFINWVDSTGNLHLLGGKKCNSTQFYSDKWMLNITNRKWVSINLKGASPTFGSNACSWKLANSIWVYGGYFMDQKGGLSLLKDLWLCYASEHVPTKPEHHLPGDTLELSIVNKLIISGVILFVVMAIIIHLCYKRELNQMLSQLKRQRVPYHHLSQEDEKKPKF